MPGTTTWKPIGEDSEAVEDVSGVLIIRIRENLDFGRLDWSNISSLMSNTLLSSQHCPDERLNNPPHVETLLLISVVERLRRMELYGHDQHHPSEEPHRQHAHTLVFHLADMDSVDAS